MKSPGIAVGQTTVEQTATVGEITVEQTTVEQTTVEQTIVDQTTVGATATVGEITAAVGQATAVGQIIAAVGPKIKVHQSVVAVNPNLGARIHLHQDLHLQNHPRPQLIHQIEVLLVILDLNHLHLRHLNQVHHRLQDPRPGGPPGGLHHLQIQEIHLHQIHPKLCPQEMPAIQIQGQPHRHQKVVNKLQYLPIIQLVLTTRRIFQVARMHPMLCN